jgi:PST family polysaccharide transporter
MFSGIFTNIVRVLVQLVMLPVMARLLGPSELGLYALALPMVNFVLLLSDAGLGDSLAKEKSGDSLVWSSAFWGLMTTGTVAMGAVYGASFIVAGVTHQPRLPMVILPLSATLLLVAVTVIPAARMLRAGNLVPGAMGDTAAAVLSAVIGVSMALLGYGVWAMVAQFVSSYIIRAIAYNIAQPFRPRLEFSGRSLLAHTGMGGQILFQRLVDLGVSMFERSRVSLKLGTAAVGGYANAAQIGLFTSNAVGSPIWANLYYVAINKSPAETVTAFIRSHRIFALVVFPAAAFLACAVPTIVPLLFGPKWNSSVSSIIVMVLTCPFGNLGTFHSAVLYARGYGRYVLYAQACAMAFRLVVVIFFWQYGIFGLSVGWGASSLLYYVGTNLVMSRLIGNRPSDLFGAAWSPLLASAVGGGILYAFLGAEPTILRLFIGGALAVTLYAGALYLLDRKRIVDDLTAMLAIVGLRPAPEPA